VEGLRLDLTKRSWVPQRRMAEVDSRKQNRERDGVPISYRRHIEQGLDDGMR